MITPSQAYWNQRHALASARDLLLTLANAINKPLDLTSFQWAQLYAMALEFRPHIILELGRDTGNSTCVFTEAARQLSQCRVVSLCFSTTWEDHTLPKIQPLVPAGWFDPLRIEHADILTFNYEEIFGGAARIMIFWDAHGYDIAECVLGRILPLIQDRPHLVMNHDMSDLRYQPDEFFHDYYLWKGLSNEPAYFQIGDLVSNVQQAISVTDFLARNNLTFFSADHDLHTQLPSNGTRFLELQSLLGDKLFSLSADWRWFSLNERPGPFVFPKIRPQKQSAQESQASANGRLPLISRAKMAAKIVLNR
jgi:hypothetical protein